MLVRVCRALRLITQQFVCQLQSPFFPRLHGGQWPDSAALMNERQQVGNFETQAGDR
jgi:hypothetical protein